MNNTDLTPYYESPCNRAVLYAGDCLDVLRALPAESVDSIVTDPPAGISFMNKSWDRDKGGRDQWIAWMAEVAAAALAACKPGSHALVWALPRTSHWTATAWEDAGWEVRERVSHIFATGMPKGLSVRKGMDKAAGAERAVAKKAHISQAGTHEGLTRPSHRDADGTHKTTMQITAPATDLAKQWEGWHTGLKPSIEDWWLLRKPLVGTIVQNVTKYGTGALNIDACRVGTEGGGTHCSNRDEAGKCKGHQNAGRSTSGETFHGPNSTGGRWPSHLILDGSDAVAAGFPQTAPSKSTPRNNGASDSVAKGKNLPHISLGYNDSGGSAARYFYCAKPSKSEREAGLGDLKASHPTVKAVALMRYLCRLVTPSGGIVLDPFAGSGSTGVGALAEGFRFLGSEQEEEYLEIAARRLAHAAHQDGT